MSRPEAPRRGDYRIFYPIATRWGDNDVYGHVNNVVYYAWFDCAVNRYLMEAGGLDYEGDGTVGFVVSSGCEYLAPVRFPEAVEAGLRVDRLGGSSVRYGVGIFRAGEDSACAFGHFVHVFVDRTSNRSVPIPGALRDALEALAAP